MKLKYILLIVVVALGVLFFGKRVYFPKASAGNVKKKVLILGFDGMDPQILQRLVDMGKMPAFKALMESGDFSILGTSIPPQSPVAWSNFITGMNPGGHGIFDFIHRDPDTMIPYLSTSKTEPSKHTVRVGDWVIPLTGANVTLLRHGKSFWEILNENGIPATIVRVPANFPPVNIPVRQLSGMGTPDIQGTYGTFSFYTTEAIDKYGDVSGGRVFPVKVNSQKIQAKLLGPRNSYLKSAPQLAVDFTVYIDSENPVAKIKVQDNQVVLNQGEWSKWVKVNFKVIPFVQSVSGVCRFYLKEVRPDFKLYVTPINIDPSSPALPISVPESYSKELQGEIGLFYTQGIPEDSKALSEKVIEDGEYLQQTNIVLEEEERMFDYELGRFKSGVLFVYFGRVDQLGHMFWRTMDPKHPAHDPKTKYSEVIEGTYRDMDRILSRALKTLDDSTTLIVLSDHGFAPFYRAFNLNSWLRKEGYISTIDGLKNELYQNVDWTNTLAYGLGFNGLYINQLGREKNGVVRSGQEKEDLLEEISKKLLTIRDPKTGEYVVTKVYRTRDIYSGAFTDEAPDLIVGYNRGYRASWQTVLGIFSEDLIADNLGKWSGSHLMEAELVPGILLSNKRIKTDHPFLYDLAPTVLAEYGIAPGEGMIGRSVF